MICRTVFLLYEKGHVEELERLWYEQPEWRADALVVAATPTLEARLKERGIACVSGREYRPPDSSRFLLSEQWTAAMLKERMGEWFTYREVSLSDIFFFPIQYCLLHALYYGAMIEKIYRAYPNMQTLVVFPSLQGVPLKGRPLDGARVAATVDCARLIGARYGFTVVVPEKQDAQQAHAGFSYKLKEFVIERAIDIWNSSISLLRGRGSPRILASDYWRNIAPILAQLPRGELILFDRAEALKAGFANLWKYRVRLYNFNSFSSHSTRAGRDKVQKLFEKRWKETREEELPSCLLGEVSLKPLLRSIMEDVILNETPKVLHNIDGAYALLAACAPDIVSLRTSFSSQSHFYILALTARALGIPSLELQHGLEYLGLGSISQNHTAEYVAVYGPLVQDEFAALGFPREKYPIVGSPRFDAYRSSSSAVSSGHKGEKGMSVLCIGFTADAECMYDDYDVRDYYSALARALEQIPNSSVVVKLRAGTSEENQRVVEDIFARVPHKIAQQEPLSELFGSADAVVSYYSTSVLEALQFGKPVVLYSAQQMEKEQIRFHFTRYEEINACRIADTEANLTALLRSLTDDSAARALLAQGAKKATEQFHLFDGRASERIVELIKRLSQKRL